MTEMEGVSDDIAIIMNLKVHASTGSRLLEILLCIYYEVRVLSVRIRTHCRHIRARVAGTTGDLGLILARTQCVEKKN